MAFYLMILCSENTNLLLFQRFTQTNLEICIMVKSPRLFLIFLQGGALEQRFGDL